MKRREFFKKVALPSLLLGVVGCAVKPEDNSLTSCSRASGEEGGPWAYPGGEGTNPLKRSDITEGQPGVVLAIKIALVNFNGHCVPVPDASVHIWHCNKDGYYSGYP